MEVCTIAIPLLVAVPFLLRSSDSYSEKYEHSKLRFLGVPKSKYILMFRIIGFFCLFLSAFAIYKNYIAEESSELEESKEFWEEIERNSKSGAVKGAVLLGAAIAIPARMSSTRFPGKPLALLGGKPVIERVYRNCLKSKLAQKVVILTDSPEISEFGNRIGAPVIMTSKNCRSGTDRIIEAVGEIKSDFVVNVQGDEPFIDCGLIDAVIEANKKNGCEVVTAASRISDPKTLTNPNVVKVLRDNLGRAVYFSRSPLPYVRDEPRADKWLEHASYWRHVGIYGYSAKALARYGSLPVSAMETCEMLEQLRFIAAGYRFEIVETEYKSIGIDTPDDLKNAEKYITAYAE